jgi:hypothetical protein
VKVFFHEPTAREIAVHILTKVHVTDGAGAERLAIELEISMEQCTPWAIVTMWRDCGALSGNKHLDDVIMRRVEIGLSTVYPEPQESYLAIASLMPASWSREERAGPQSARTSKIGYAATSPVEDRREHHHYATERLCRRCSKGGLSCSGVSQMRESSSSSTGSR